MYKIMGKYQGKTEEIDSVDTEQEADELLSEYKMAYGPSWILWVVIK